MRAWELHCWQYPLRGEIRASELQSLAVCERTDWALTTGSGRPYCSIRRCCGRATQRFFQSQAVRSSSSQTGRIWLVSQSGVVLARSQFVLDISVALAGRCGGRVFFPGSRPNRPGAGDRPITSVRCGVVFASRATLWTFDFKIGCISLRSIIAAMGATASLVSGIVLSHSGLPFRVPPEARRLTSDTAYFELGCMLFKYPITNVPGCHIGETSKSEDVILIGDSHALSVLSAVDEALKHKGRGGRIFTAASCPPILGLMFPITRESDCIGFYSIVRSKTFGPPQNTIIILVGRWSSYLYGHNEDRLRSALGFEGVDNFESLPMDEKERIFSERIARGICQFAVDGKIYAVSSIPEMKYNVPMRAARDVMSGRFSEGQYGLPRDEYAQRNRLANSALAAAAKRCGARILDPTKYLCDSAQCYGMRNGRPIYIDSNHLNRLGDGLLVPMFESLLQ